MHVKKRDGRLEKVKFDKVTARVENLCHSLDLTYIKPDEIAKQIIESIFDGVTTQQLDEVAAEIAAGKITSHPDFSILAGRIAVSNLHKTTGGSFFNVVQRLYKNVDQKTNEHAPLVSTETFNIVRKNAAKLDSVIVHDRDLDYDYFGIKTLENSYLLKINGKIVERPQHMLMRVAIGIHGENLDAAIETYHLMSERWFTHATPTLFNAGTPKPQLSSCFLLTMKEDSIDGIYETLKNTAKISQAAGGIGISIHDIRAKGSYIKGTGGVSNGIVPMLRNFDMTARYVDQGGGKRKGSFAIYIEPWHADISEFLQLKKNHGKEELRARDLFYALWIPDLFMQKVEANEEWCLFCPNESPGLSDVYGKAFDQLYNKYEKEGKYRRKINAQELWFDILESQMETGTPYILYKDACNRKSNQKNLGTIKSSNLCTEIIEYTSPDEVAVCNLASLALPKFVIDGQFDLQKLYDVTYIVTKNLNKVIDVNYYPIKEAKTSNMRHRPIGLGVQGLADTFMLLRFPFESQEARKLNKDISETMYFAAMTASKDLAIKDGPYETYDNSPVSQGVFQYDMWGVTPSDRWDWHSLKREVRTHGVRNSLLIAPMPTASTSQILGNNECFEPYTSNLYNRGTLSGTFAVVNKHLMKDLIKLGLWDENMKNKMIANKGSIQNLPDIPEDIKKLYKTVWEISQRIIIDMAADRGAYTCQSQSMNLFTEDPNKGKLTSMHFYAWKSGLKTGIYYLRSKAAVNPIQFTVDKAALKENDKQESKTQNQIVADGYNCSLDDPDCLSCSG